MDHIGVIDFRDQGEKCHGGGIVQGKAVRQAIFFSTGSPIWTADGKPAAASLRGGKDAFAVGGRRSLHIRGRCQIREEHFPSLRHSLKHIRRTAAEAPAPRELFQAPRRGSPRQRQVPCGVDPACGGKHGGLRSPLPGIAKPFKDLLVRFTAVIPAQTEKFPEPWDQEALLSRNVKSPYPVRTGIVPVYKSRLRCG